MYPLQENKSAFVVEKLLDIFALFHIPHSILSDNVAEFNSELMQLVAIILDIEKITCSPYYLQSNEQVRSKFLMSCGELRQNTKGTPNRQRTGLRGGKLQGRSNVFLRTVWPPL